MHKTDNDLEFPPGLLPELLQSLRYSSADRLDPGFYSRVLDRIQSAKTNSIWSFAHTGTGTRLFLFLCSVALLLASVLLFEDVKSNNRRVIVSSSGDGTVLVTGSPDQQRSAVIMNLVSNAVRDNNQQIEILAIGVSLIMTAYLP